MEMFFLLPLRCDEVASPLFVTRSDVLWMSRSFILFMFECFFFYSSVFMAFDVGLFAMLPVILFSLTNLLYFFWRKNTVWKHSNVAFVSIFDRKFYYYRCASDSVYRVTEISSGTQIENVQGNKFLTFRTSDQNRTIKSGRPPKRVATADWIYSGRSLWVKSFRKYFQPDCNMGARTFCRYLRRWYYLRAINLFIEAVFWVEKYF